MVVQVITNMLNQNIYMNTIVIKSCSGKCFTGLNSYSHRFMEMVMPLDFQLNYLGAKMQCGFATSYTHLGCPDV